MPIEALKKSKRRTVGAKQTVKALENNRAEVVFVAKDADERMVREILSHSEVKGVAVEFVDTMAVLGKACGIDVGAASAAILKEEQNGGR